MALEPKPTFSNLIQVDIKGITLPRELADLIGGWSVDYTMNLSAAFSIQFNDNYQDMMKNSPGVFELGNKVELYVIVNGTGKSIPLLTGQITGIETDGDGITTTTVIRGLDNSYKMMRHSRTKSYKQMTATAIVSELAEQDGVTLSSSVESSTVIYKMITQANVSDWQFARDLATRNGMYVDFDNKGHLRFRKIPEQPGSILSENFPDLPNILQVGGNAIQCRIGITSADQFTRATVRGWDVTENKQLKSGTEPKIYRGRKTLAGAASALTGAAAAAAGGESLEYIETRTPYGADDEVQTTASALAEEIGSVASELEVLATGSPGLVPGETVEVTEAGDKFNGFYTITAAKHEVNRKGHYRTLVTVTGHQVRNLYGLTAGASARADRIHGVVNAIVTDIDDDLNQGRVKVSFPWLDDTYTTRWARSLQFGGQGGGGVISPAVNDEVLVAFDRGDIDYPYVLGGLYGHELNKPSEHDTQLVTSPGHLNRQSLVSRAGHRLELLNADDAVPLHGVRLQSGDKMLTVFLDQAETEIMIKSDGSVSITGKEKVSVTSDGDVSVTATGAVSVKAASVSIEAASISLTGAVSIKGDLAVTGATEATGDVSIFGGLNQLGDAAFAGDVTVIGAFSVDGIPYPPV